MSEEEKKAYEELKSLLYTGTISQYGKRKLIYIIEEQQNKIASLKKQIKLMQSCDLAKVIKKQQKEIEELRAINEMQKYRIEVIDERELISKDKIRKLKEYYEDSLKYAENEIESNNIYVSIKNLEKILEE